jgi:hypothetical protein
MTPCERGLAVDLLKVFDREMANQRIAWFLYSGTLLGSWRHHGIIPWDDDVDVFVDQSQKKNLTMTLKKLAPEFITVEYGSRVKFFSKLSVKTNTYSWKWPFLDIQFYTGDSTHIWDTDYSFSHLKYKKSDIFPFHKRPFEGHWFPAPRNSLAMFKINYRAQLNSCFTSWMYNHKTEHFQKPVRVKCRTMKDRVPFVHRKLVNVSMVETLKLGDTVIQSMVVEELPELVTDPYDLSRIITPGSSGTG